jgi:hypothetical protein
MKLDLLTNATVVDDAIRFVSSKSNENYHLVKMIKKNQTNLIMMRIEEETGETTVNEVF